MLGFESRIATALQQSYHNHTFLSFVLEYDSVPQNLYTFMCLKECHLIRLDKVLTGRLGLPFLQNDEHIDQNTSIFHRDLCIATNRGTGGATMELHILHSVASTYHTFLLKSEVQVEPCKTFITYEAWSMCCEVQ